MDVRLEFAETNQNTRYASAIEYEEKSTGYYTEEEEADKDCRIFRCMVSELLNYDCTSCTEKIYVMGLVLQLHFIC